MSTHNDINNTNQQQLRTNHSNESPLKQNNRTIGNNDLYVIEKEIGKGSFAIVYRAHLTTNSNNHVAVKAVARSKLKNKKLLENLEIEIAILKKIKHNHIVSLIDCQRTDSDFFLIMEYCALGDLTFLIKKRKDLIKNHPLLQTIFEKYPPPDDNHNGLNSAFILNYLQQLSSALKFLRSKNLVHRDIKPQNLLLSTPLLNYTDPETFHKLGYVGIYNLPILKIADFGFARFLPNSSLAETLCGSPLYMAPEILNYQKYNAKADLWSVGTVLFEMGAGHPPFKASNHLELYKKIKRSNDQITFPNYFSTNYQGGQSNTTITTTTTNNNSHGSFEEDLDRDLKDLICKLLTFNPINRISFEEFFNNKLVNKDLSCYELDGNNSTDLENKSKNVVESNMFISEYIPSTKKKQQSSQLQYIEKDLPLREEDNINTANKYIQNDKSTSNEITRQKNPTHTTLINPITSNSDLVLEKEYVVVEKKTVEVNELADELAQLNRSPINKTNRNDSESHNQITPNMSPRSNNIPLNTANNNNNPHNIYSNSPDFDTFNMLRKNSSEGRRPSLNDRRISITSLNPTNALSKALGIASTRIFGNPQHIKSNNSLSSNKSLVPIFNPQLFKTMAEDMILKVDNEWGSKINSRESSNDSNEFNNNNLIMNNRVRLVHSLEILSAKAFVVYTYAEVKFEQLVPLYSNSYPKRLSTGSDVLDMEDDEIHQRDEEFHRKEFAHLVDDLVINPELRLLCKEAITLYLKSLELLGNAMQITSKWWYESNEKMCSLKLNLLVQWIRDKFNECLEKAELLRLKFYESLEQDELKTEDVEDVYIEKLLYGRALEISKTAANMELHGKNLNGCELSYATSMWMLQTALENDSSSNILDEQDRNIIKKYIDSILNRLKSLRLKMNNQI